MFLVCIRRHDLKDGMPLTLVLRSDIASGHSPQWVSESGIASPVVSEAVFYVRHCMTCVNVVWDIA